MTIFDCLTDPNDCVMLALTSKNLAVHYNYLTATGHTSIPSVLGLSPLKARINIWLGRDRRYCRLCKTVKNVDRKWWSEVAWHMYMENRSFSARHHYISVKRRGLLRFSGKSISNWCFGTMDEEPEYQLERALLKTLPLKQRQEVEWNSVCPLHATH